MAEPLSSDRGAITAEFAVVLPAVLVVIALCAGTIGVAVQQATLVRQASEAARMLSRGDDQQGVLARLSGSAPSVAREDGLVCVSVQRRARLGPVGLGRIELHARQCALG